MKFNYEFELSDDELILLVHASDPDRPHRVTGSTLKYVNLAIKLGLVELRHEAGSTWATLTPVGKYAYDEFIKAADSTDTDSEVNP